MNVFDPLSTYSSPSRRAVDFIDPNASDPDPGSVIAQAPILSIVSRSSAHRSFWAIVPLARIAADVRPIDTPMAVTMPGLHRHSSMIGIIWNAVALAASTGSRGGASSAPAASSTSPAAAALSRAIWRSNRSRAMASMPKLRNSFRMMSYGGRSPCSSSRWLRHDLLLDEVAHRGPHHLLLF